MLPLASHSSSNRVSKACASSDLMNILLVHQMADPIQLSRKPLAIVIVFTHITSGSLTAMSPDCVI
jgi:hypothetical protein